MGPSPRPRPIIFYFSLKGYGQNISASIPWNINMITSEIITR